MRKLCAAFIATCVVPSSIGAQAKSKPAQEKSGARVKPS
jgi:Spy/CpxP family protein refolding chaperone